MKHLGQTRSCHQPNHLLLTPDTFVRAPLPGMRNATAIIHAAPRLGARFVQYSAEFEPGGELGDTLMQRFIYLLTGALHLTHQESEIDLKPGGYAYIPARERHSVVALGPATALVIEKPHEHLVGQLAPVFFVGAVDRVPSQPLMGDPSVQVRPLIPDSRSFDFAINSMTFEPGASLPMVEIHVMEHGLFMLDGGGIYRLGDCWHPVTAGDFIWMAPYCPQWFCAVGKTPAQYLIYKDWNRYAD
jgi:(S)-ureidoglycine aminohydrolase